MQNRQASGGDRAIAQGNPAGNGLAGSFTREAGRTKDSLDRLVGLLDAWQAFCKAQVGEPVAEGKRIIGLSHHHSVAFTLLCNRPFGQEDMDRFCQALSSFEDTENFAFKAGIFLSAMMNIGEGQEYVVNTRGIRTPLHHLGACSSKKIIIRGDAGDHAGDFLNRGEMTIEGKAGNAVGSDMQSGLITVKGRAGFSVGAGSNGGTILLESGCDGVAPDAKAKIEPR
ncbi:hypothetical protein L0Y65_00650 [Candidatus Micrarchaeota archaeon]|nr:hypothetical protein [Candidatus Micrarchaeota archaeon]